MGKAKQALTYQERSDRNLAWFTAGAALLICIVLVVIPTGLDEWNDHFEQHSPSLLQRIASYF